MSDEICFNRGMTRKLLRLALIGCCLASGAAAASTRPEAPETSTNVASPTRIRAKIMRGLFAQLRDAPDAESATRTRSLIANLWMRHDSPTADLLMARADIALAAGRVEALDLLDKIIGLYPDWAQAWRRRAQAERARGDDESAEADLRRALTAEPRDFIAMSQLADLLRQSKRDEAALDLLRRELELDPRNDPLRAEVEQLSREIEGQRI